MGLFGQIEICQCDMSVLTHENVFGLQISIDEADVVEVFESKGHCETERRENIERFRKKIGHRWR